MRVISSSRLQVTVHGCPRLNLMHFGYFLPFELEKAKAYTATKEMGQNTKPLKPNAIQLA